MPTTISSVPLIATGDWIDAAWLNQYIRDNFLAIQQAYTQKGALAYATAANALAELAPPAGLSLLTHAGAGGVPAWFAKGAANYYLAVSADGLSLEWKALAFSSKGAYVRNNGSVTILNNTPTSITFATELIDQDNFFSAGSPTLLTVPTSGWYIATGFVTFASNATGVRKVNITVNTVAEATIAQDAMASDVTTITISSLFWLSAGNYLQLQVYQNSGGNLAVTTSYLQVVKLFG